MATTLNIYFVETAMPRRPRLSIPHLPVHLIQRAGKGQTCFYAEKDFRYYLLFLNNYAEAAGCILHAYVLMTDHIHLLVTPTGKDSIGNMMKGLSQRYVQYLNRTYQLSGTLWQGRFRSCIVQPGQYSLLCRKYIELNPVRTGLVDQPGNYYWSSYGANAREAASEIELQHCLHVQEGQTPMERQAANHTLSYDGLSPAIVDTIRKATNSNSFFGDDSFRKEIEKITGRRIVPGKRGRPVKQSFY